MDPGDALVPVRALALALALALVLVLVLVSVARARAGGIARVSAAACTPRPSRALRAGQCPSGLRITRSPPSQPVLVAVHVP
ncbi:hypothetical protein GCM10023089_12170 [Quisquiliibacterium transsilvanicum]